MRRGAPLERKTAVYWVGVVPPKPGDEKSHPPMQTITLGGVTFPLRHTPWEEHREGENKRGEYLGYLVRLTDEQVDQVKAACRKTIVRWRERAGRHAHGYLVRLIDDAEIAEAADRWKLSDAQIATYRARVQNTRIMPSDEPASRYVYCVRVSDNAEAEEGAPWRPSAQVPKPIIETGIESP
jgi:hypothetical protein